MISSGICAGQGWRGLPIMTQEGPGLRGRSRELPGFPAAAGAGGTAGDTASPFQAPAEQSITEPVLRDCCPDGDRGPGRVRAPAGPGETTRWVPAPGSEHQPLLCGVRAPRALCRGPSPHQRAEAPSGSAQKWVGSPHPLTLSSHL